MAEMVVTMSYCRFSSEGFTSDVYVYKDCDGGWTILVASMRIDERAPEVWEPGIDQQELSKRYAAFSAHMGTVGRHKIGLSHDGELFNFPTPGECAAMLEALRTEGYNVPQYAIDALNYEEASTGGDDG